MGQVCLLIINILGNNYMYGGISAALTSGSKTIQATSSSTNIIMGVEIQEGTTLPVELISFTGKNEKNFNELFWSTSSEINSEYFEVMRSSDGLNFESIGKVKGAGNSNNILSYVFVDYEQLPGINYYRLAQFDYDGKNETFNIVAIDNNGAAFKLNSLFPNPATSSMTVNFQSKEAKPHSIFICDAQGNEVFKAMIATLQGENQFTLPTQNYASGTYFVRISSAKNESVSSTIVVQH